MWEWPCLHPAWLLPTLLAGSMLHVNVFAKPNMTSSVVGFFKSKSEVGGPCRGGLFGAWGLKE